MWQELRDKVRVSKGHSFGKNGRNKNQKKPHAHSHMIRRQSIKFQISPMKEVRGVAGTRSARWKEGQNDRTEGQMHTQMDEGHFNSPPLPR